MAKLRVPKWSSLMQGAALLGAAAVISKLIGVAQKVPLQNIAGDGVFGIYSTVYPFYILVLFLSTAGFPVAVSKFIAESAAVGDQDSMRKIVRVSSGILLSTGVIGFSFLYFGAGVIAEAIGNASTKTAIQSVAYALLFVPMLSVLKGYFQGLQKMLPTSLSQVVEQLVRVLTMLALLLWMTAHGFSDERVAAGAMLGSASGALAGLLVMFGFWRKRAPQPPLPTPSTASVATEPSYWSWGKKLLAYAIPVCLGSIVVPIVSIVDTFTVPRLLSANGWNDAQAMEQMGVLSRGLTLTQLMAMLFSSVSVAVIPLMARLKMKGQLDQIKTHTTRILHTTWMVGLAASIGAWMTAVPINVMLFTDQTGSTVMAVMTVSIVFSVVNIMSAALLQGMGFVIAPAIHLFLAILVKTMLNMMLIPQYGIIGSSIGAVMAFFVASVLNVWMIRRHVAFKLSIRTFIVHPVIMLVMMSAVLAILRYACPLALSATSLSERAVYSVTACVMVIGGAGVFALFYLYTYRGKSLRARFQFSDTEREG